MSEPESHPISSGDIAVTERPVNGTPLRHAHARHRGGSWQLSAGQPEGPQDRAARVRLLTASAIGVGLLIVAHWVAPEQHSLLAAPSGAAGWLALICGAVGVWLVPGLWICALLVRVGFGPAAWLGARIAVTLSWYAAVGPVYHYVGRAEHVTTLGLLTMTTVATGAVCVGVLFGLSRLPVERWRRFVIAAVVGGGCAQIGLWLSKLTLDDATYAHGLAVNWTIVVSCALLTVVGTLSRPQLPPSLRVRNIRTPLIAMAVVAVTLMALWAAGSIWSPAQRMPSSFAVEQIPAPTGADIALALTAIGPDGSEFVRRADFTASDDIGRPVPVEMRLVPAEGAQDRATLLVVLPRSSQPDLCTPGRMEVAVNTGAPIKLTMRDQASGLIVQPEIPFEWCTG
jgi:hypothetical protein